MAGYTEEQYEQSIDPTPANPPKGSAEWAEQNSGENAPGLTPSVSPPKGTLEAYEQQQPQQQPQAPAIEPKGNAPGASVQETAKKETPKDVPANNAATTDGDAPIYKGSSLAEILPQLEDYVAKHKPETEEQRKKRERRERTEGIISGISDAVQSLSNLVFTTQYAPNMYNAGDGLSAKAKERFEKAKAEREAEGDKYFNYALSIGKLKDDDAKEQRNWNHTLEREKVQDARNEAADARAQAKADRDAAMAQLKMMYMQGQLDAQKLAAEINEVEKQYANQYWNAKIGRLNYRPPVRSGGGGGRSGGSGKPGEYPWYDADGNKHYAHSYEAARQNSLDHGTWNEATQQSTSQKTQQKGRKTTTTNTTTTKPAKGHSSKPAAKKSAKSSFSIHK